LDASAARIYAVDVPDDMVALDNIRFCKDSSVTVGHSNVIRDPIERIAWERVDVVVAPHILNYAPTKESIDLHLSKVYKLLKLGGIYLTIINSSLRPAEDSAWGVYIDETQPIESGSVVVIDIYSEDSHPPLIVHNHQWSLEDVADGMRRNGFEDVRIAPQNICSDRKKIIFSVRTKNLR
jgi:hypothetical protein